MSEKCFNPNDFERVLDLVNTPAKDSLELDHLKTCMDCKTELDLYRSFINMDSVPEGANLSDANQRLGSFIDKEIGGQQSRIVNRSSVPRRRRRFAQRWAPLAAAACLVAVAIFINSENSSNIAYPTGVVRDMSGQVPALSNSETLTDDGFVLTWTGPENADSFEIVVFNSAMTEIKRFEATQSGEYIISFDEHPWMQIATPVLWYVIAKQDGDEIARSTLRALELDP